jgi:hypothetical protein
MHAQMREAATKSFLREMRQRLDKPASLAKGAEACADAGNVEKGLEDAVGIEQLDYEANALLNAASMVHRISKT